MTQEDGKHCPPSEVLAAYIDGSITEAERAQIEAHVATCPDCYELVVETMRFADEVAEVPAPIPIRPVPVARSRRFVVIGGAVLAAAASLLLVVRANDPLWWERYVRQVPRPELVQIVAAVGERRPIEARLTGGFHYGPAPTVRRGATDAGPSPDVQIAAAELEKTAAASDTAANLAALGTAKLAVGDTDAAVALLEDAVSRAPAGTAFQSDLAAAYLARYDAQARADDLPKALAAAERALQAADAPIEALFNRALALEKLQLRNEAAQAWNAYLARDASSPWAGEAREHLASLQSAVVDPPGERLAALRADDSAAIADAVRDFRQESREFVEDRLLVDWATSATDGAQRLQLAGVIAGELERQTGDRLLAAAVQRLTARSAGSQAGTSLRDAHAAFAGARRHFSLFQLDQARPLFESARDRFAAGGSPYRLWADVYLAILTYYRRDLPEADRLLADLARSAPAEFASLHARVLWMRSLIHTDMGEFGKALAEELAALSVYERVGEQANAAGIENLLSETYRQLGDDGSSWRYRVSALGRLKTRNSRVRQSLLLGGAQTAVDGDLAIAGLPFGEEAAESAKEDGAAPCAQVQVRLAATLRRLQRQAQAREALAAAENCLEKVGDPSLNRRLSSEIVTERGLSPEAAGDTASVAALTRAIEYLDRATLSAGLPQLYLERGRVHAAAGRLTDAAQDFDRGIAVFERFRSAPSTSLLRVSYFDESWRLFDELIALQARAGDFTRALETAERRRSSAADTKGDPRPTIAAVQERLPEGTVLLYYCVLDDRLLAWAIAHDRVDAVDRSLTASHLDQLVNRLQRLAVTPASENGLEAAAALYDAVIRPLSAHIPAGASLVIVADQSLHRLAFASLYDAERRRFLLEEHAVSVAPSLKWAMTGADAAPDTAPIRTLVIVPPATSIERGLRPLVHALDEGRTVASLSRDARLLQGGDATAETAQSLMSGYGIVHFAGHAVANPEFPSLSRLLLAPGHGSSVPDMLFAEGIEQMDLSHVSLVVLSACGTASGRISRGQGPLGLSRAFLVAGAGAVIGTLWDVDDLAARALFERFYARLKSGHDPARALRDAQLELLRSNDPRLRDIRAWAAFVHVGRPTASRSSSMSS